MFIIGINAIPTNSFANTQLPNDTLAMPEVVVPVFANDKMETSSQAMVRLINKRLTIAGLPPANEDESLASRIVVSHFHQYVKPVMPFEGRDLSRGSAIYTDVIFDCGILGTNSQNNSTGKYTPSIRLVFQKQNDSIFSTNRQWNYYYYYKLAATYKPGGKTLSFKIDNIEQGYYSIYLIDARCKTVYEEELFVTATKLLNVGIPSTPAGTYFISLFNSNREKMLTQKITITN